MDVHCTLWFHVCSYILVIVGIRKMNAGKLSNSTNRYIRAGSKCAMQSHSAIISYVLDQATIHFVCRQVKGQTWNYFEERERNLQ